MARCKLSQNEEQPLSGRLRGEGDNPPSPLCQLIALALDHRESQTWMSFEYAAQSNPTYNPHSHLSNSLGRNCVLIANWHHKQFPWEAQPQERAPPIRARGIDLHLPLTDEVGTRNRCARVKGHIPIREVDITKVQTNFRQRFLVQHGKDATSLAVWTLTTPLA